MERPVEELETIWELCQRIDLSPDKTRLESGLLEPTAGLLRAETAVFRAFCRGHTKPVVIVGLGIRDCVHDAYLNRYIELDPIRRLLTKRFARPLIAEHDQGPHEPWTDEYIAAIDGANTDNSACSSQTHQEEFRRYLREFLLPNNFFHHVGFCFQNESGSKTFLLDYHRSEGSSPFGQLDVARAKIIAMLLQARAANFRSAADIADPCRDPVRNGRDLVIRERYRAIDDPGGLRLAGRLSARELEVAEVVARGLTNKQVGDALGISVRTVENHMRSIFTKLKISTRTRLAAKLHELTPMGPATRRRLT